MEYFKNILAGIILIISILLNHIYLMYLMELDDIPNEKKYKQT